MGLKSGSRDAGLDDESADEDEGDRADATAATDDGGTTPDATDGDETGSSTDDATRPTVSSLPYTLRRDRVNEGRSQIPFFLREAVVDGETELQDTLEGMLGEEVYKSDYREAAMVVAQRNPELVAAVLREWGYDLDTA